MSRAHVPAEMPAGRGLRVLLASREGGVRRSAGGWGGTNPWISTPSSLEHHPGSKLEDRRSSIAIGVSDEEENRDTIRLHEKEEVTLATLPTHHPVSPLPWCRLPSYPANTLFFPSSSSQKNILRYYLFEGMRYIWIERRQAYCKVRYFSLPPCHSKPLCVSRLLSLAPQLPQNGPARLEVT